MNKSAEVQKGFFKRLFNAINTKRYESNKLNKEKYLINWDKLKWRYRVGKLFFLFSFYFGGNYFFFKNNLDLETMKKEAEENKIEFNNLLSCKWSKFDDTNYFEQIQATCGGLKQFFTSELEKGEKLNLNENKEYEFLFFLTKNLLDVLEKRQNIANNENFKYLDLKDGLGNFFLNGNNLLSKIIFAQYKKMYNKDNPLKEIENAIMYSELFYKKLICTIIPKNYLILSTNLIEELPSLEHTAFAVAFNLIEFFGSINMSQSIENDFNIFFEKINNKNLNYFNGKYKDEIKLILEDVKRHMDLKTYLIVNPFLYLNFTREIEELKEILIQKQTEINIRKISLSVDLLNNAGFDITKVSNFTFDKNYYQILDIYDNENSMRNTIEKYLRKKINEISKDKQNQIVELDDIKNYDFLKLKWRNINS